MSMSNNTTSNISIHTVNDEIENLLCDLEMNIDARENNTDIFVTPFVKYKLIHKIKRDKWLDKVNRYTHKKSLSDSSYSNDNDNDDDNDKIMNDDFWSNDSSSDELDHIVIECDKSTVEDKNDNDQSRSSIDVDLRD